MLFWYFFNTLCHFGDLFISFFFSKMQMFQIGKEESLNCEKLYLFLDITSLVGNINGNPFCLISYIYTKVSISSIQYHFCHFYKKTRNFNNSITTEFWIKQQKLICPSYFLPNYCNNDFNNSNRKFYVNTAKIRSIVKQCAISQHQNYRMNI
jgi:hypothetical protein